MKEIQRISSIVFYFFVGLSVLVALLYYLGGNEPKLYGTLVAKRFTNVALIWNISLIAVATLVTLAFTLLNVFTDRKAAKGFLFVFLIAAVLIVISYLMASSEPLPNLQMEKAPSPFILKLVGTGLIINGILIAVSFISIIASEIYRSVK